MFCSRRVFFQQIQILHTKHFFVYQLGEEQKSPVIFQGTLVSAITLHMYAFSIQQTVMFVYGSTDDHMFDGMSKCLNRSLFTSLEMFYTLKMSLLRIW